MGAKASTLLLNIHDAREKGNKGWQDGMRGRDAQNGVYYIPRNKGWNRSREMKDHQVKVYWSNCLKMVPGGPVLDSSKNNVRQRLNGLSDATKNRAVV